MPVAAALIYVSSVTFDPQIRVDASITTGKALPGSARYSASRVTLRRAVPLSTAPVKEQPTF